ncbi:MAG TPA: hypothetical protein VLD60_12485 [Nitrospira sp.]|nr:hypothetical protein [Nitrospira sp.]
MTRIISMFALAAFLSVGFGTVMTFATEPAPAEQKEKKDMNGGKADEEKKKEDKQGVSGK